MQCSVRDIPGVSIVGMSDTEQQEIYYAVFHLWAYDLLGTIQWRGVAYHSRVAAAGR